MRGRAQSGLLPGEVRNRLVTYRVRVGPTFRTLTVVTALFAVVGAINRAPEWTTLAAGVLCLVALIAGVFADYGERRAQAAADEEQRRPEPVQSSPADSGYRR